MPLLNLILNLFLMLIFIWLVFLFSWYVALPLLILWALFGVIRLLHAKIQERRYRRMANGCTFRPASSDTHTTIIDADYTEVP